MVNLRGFHAVFLYILDFFNVIIFLNLYFALSDMI